MTPTDPGRAGPLHERPVTAAEARARGRALRETVPRTSHAGWSPPPDRADPLALLEEQNRGRVPELVPIRWGRMLQSAFAFLRGSALVMATDLASTPATGLLVQAVGDAHLGNFGTFASPERTLLFDVNDFDETLTGPWEWDVKRLAASAVVAARDAGLPEDACTGAAREAVRSYRTRLAGYADLPVLDVWYSRVDAAAASALFQRAGLSQYRRIIAEARTHTSQRALPRLTELTREGGRRIVDHPPLITHDALCEDHDELAAILDGYRDSLSDAHRLLLGRFHLEDFARKVVGVGSVGTRCYIALLVTAAGDPLLLQMKQAMSSVLARRWATEPVPHNGRRVVAGQQVMQAASDIFLGWTQGGGIDFSVRQLYDMKGSLVVAAVDGPALAEYMALCGWALARAHARSGDAAAISGYLGTGDIFDQAVTRFAADYATQTAHDHAALVEAVHTGRVSATTGA
ncbi:MAG: hypothetical protein QOG45_2422 [Chloroflexota bacterium]|nr:hypothetical protein [Chloroflexota bacterium]